MSVALPIADVTRRQTQYCTYCPKLCRSACPTTLVQAREATTPWGKMASVGYVESSAITLDPEIERSWFSCTGCMRCTSFCEHDNTVALALYDARAASVGKEPARITKLRRAHARRGLISQARAKKLLGLDPMRALSNKESVFFAGCSAWGSSSKDVLASLRVIKQLSGSTPQVQAAACCGFPLLEAGDRDGFLQHVNALRDRLRGAREVIFLDPGCLHAWRLAHSQQAQKEELRTLHISEFVANHAISLQAKQEMPTLRYHDACHLGRGLGIYDVPRDVLERLSGAAPQEFAQNRSRAECSGAGGRFPDTHRKDSQKIALELQSSHQRQGDGTLITGCPGAVSHLRRSLKEPQHVRSFIDIVDYALHEEI